MHRNVRLLIAALAVALLVVVWLAMHGEHGSAPATAPPLAKSATRSPASPGLAVPAPAPAQRSEDDLVPPAVAPASPYPPNSQPLTEGVDPASSVAEDDPVDAESGIHVVFGARRDVVHPPDPIIVDLEVLDKASHRLPIGNARAYFRGERDTAAQGTGARVAFVDDGKHAYTATFAPTTIDQKQIMRFRTFIEVAFDAPNHLGERHYSAWMQYTPKPNGELDGEWSDAIVDGSLVVQAGVAATAKGRFKVIASLYSGDSAIAFAQNAVELEVGRHSVPLLFFGKILRDRELDGPYTIRYAMLFEEFPDQGIYWPGTTADHAYTTRAYHAVDFSGDAYKEPASTEEPVTAQSPSQQGKPPPLFTR
jgi:hypothetical protein